MAKESIAAEPENALVRAVEGLQKAVESNQSVRNKTTSQVVRNSPWAKGAKTRPKLKVTVYQNGARLNLHMMSNEEIELFNQLKPGRYNHRKWEVIRRRDRSIDLRYKNKTLEQRMDLKGDAPNLPAMLRQIITEQEAQDVRKKRGDFSEDDDE